MYLYFYFVVYYLQAGTDLKQAFLIGCDGFVERSLGAAVSTLELCENEVQTLTGDCSPDAQVSDYKIEIKSVL